MNDLPLDSIEKIAEDNALAIVLAAEDPSVQTAVNNNSICEVLMSSEEFAPLCAEFCGRVREMTADAGKAVSFQCYAGLDCLAVPLNNENRPVAIIGRTFTKAENYRRATERAISGDWNKFPPTRIFENILLSSSTGNFDAAARLVEKLDRETASTLNGNGAKGRREESESRNSSERKEEQQIENIADDDSLIVEAQIVEDADLPIAVESTEPEALQIATLENEEAAAWRSFFGSLLKLSYRKACASILDFLAQRYALESLAWLELREKGFEVITATGSLKGQQFKVNLDASDRHLLDAFDNETALKLRERTKDGTVTARQTVSLFPIVIDNEVQNALVIEGEIADEDLVKNLSRFGRSVASEIEVLRLREEVKRRSWLARAVEKFNASLKNLDTEDFWANLMQISAELLRAERSSLLVFDEKSEILTVKAAIGATAESIKQQVEQIGERVARLVLQEGKPVVVADVGKIGLGPAPSDWKYKTQSFICYPFTIGERRIGVLNIADKADGTAYTEFDLELLEAIAPQVAVVIDRATLKNKAGEFEQLSVTDALTGLLNRRYLEERLAEEVKRSNRYGYPMSFLMIDVDDFGKFNKDFGVLTGDRVLREAVNAMKGTLRGADIAARYGGEEFCVLLPQTTIAEARTIAERIRQSVEKIEFPERKITISVGVSSFSQKTSTVEEIIKSADEAMRRAKKGGKNNVQFYEAL